MADASSSAGKVPDPNATGYLISEQARKHTAWVVKVFDGTVEWFGTIKSDPTLVMHASVCLSNKSKVYLGSKGVESHPDQETNPADKLTDADFDWASLADLPAAASSGASEIKMWTMWDAPEKVDAVFKAAVKEGAKTLAEPTDMPWGMRWAEVQDPWGIKWFLTAELSAAGGSSA